MTLTAVHQGLAERGIVVPYSSLSQFIALGDISNQLEVGGKGNRREFPAGTVEFLAALLPRWEQAKLSKDHAPAFVRHQLAELRGSGNAIAKSSEVLALAELRPQAHLPDALELAREYGRAVQDRLLDAAGAAEYVGVSRRSLRRHFPPSFRIGASPVGDRWRVSDLLAGPRR